MPLFLAESYPVGIGRKTLAATARRARLVAAEMSAEGSQVRFVKSTFVPKDDALICLFQAPSAELVLELGRRAGLPIERVVDAVELVAQSDAKASAQTRKEVNK